MPPVPVPMPPAIHAPVPVQQAQPAASMNARSVHQLTNETARVPINDLQGDWHHYRWQHIKHWKGKAHRSKEKRASGRKASKKAQNRRRRG